jgi:tetratricopeptide (TPR) repeat protein
MRISGNLEVTLTDSQKARLSGGDALNADAYERYLKGRYFWNQRTNEGYRNAIELFEEAIDLDPDYAQAYVGLADAQAFVEVPGGSSMAQYETALGTITKALDIDETLGEAHATMALLLQNKDWDFAGAERQYRQAIELSPSYASAFHWYGELLEQLQRTDEALEMLEQASELDPLSSAISSDIGIAWYYARDYDRAIAALEDSIAADSSFSRTHHYLAKVLAHVGRYQQAVVAQQKGWLLAGDDPEEVEQRILQLNAAAEAADGEQYWRQQLVIAEASPGSDWPVDVAALYARVGENDKAFELLEQGLAARKFAMLFLNVDPAWDGLRDDPRFEDLMRRIGFNPASTEPVEARGAEVLIETSPRLRELDRYAAVE